MHPLQSAGIDGSALLPLSDYPAGQSRWQADSQFGWLPMPPPTPPTLMARRRATSRAKQQVRIIKLVRFKGPMLHIPASLRSEHSALKVVHMVRHPEAVVASQTRMGFGNKLANGSWASPRDHLSSVCNSMWQKLLYLNITIAPDRLLRLRYEDLVLTPVETWRRVHSFAGLPSGRLSEAEVSRIMSETHVAGRIGPADSFSNKHQQSNREWRARRAHGAVAAATLPECRKVLHLLYPDAPMSDTRRARHQ